MDVGEAMKGARAATAATVVSSLIWMNVEELSVEHWPSAAMERDVGVRCAVAGLAAGDHEVDVRLHGATVVASKGETSRPCRS